MNTQAKLDRKCLEAIQRLERRQEEYVRKLDRKIERLQHHRRAIRRHYERKL